jgi:hypothetical protein
MYRIGDCAMNGDNEYTVISRYRVNFLYNMINQLRSTVGNVMDILPAVVEDSDILDEVAMSLDNVHEDLQILDSDLDELVENVGHLPTATTSPLDFIDTYILNKQMIRGFQIKANAYHTAWGDQDYFDNWNRQSTLPEHSHTPTSATNIDPEYVHHVDDRKAIHVNSSPKQKQITKQKKPSFTLGGFEVVRG